MSTRGNPCARIMKFQIAFDQTGDTIPFVSLNDQILEFYVDYLTVQNLNSFELLSPQTAFAILEKIRVLDDSIKINNSWMKILLDRTIESATALDYLDQDRLNQYHADWVNSQHIVYDIDAKRQQHNNTGLTEHIHDLFPDNIRYPQIGTVLKQLGYRDTYDTINFGIHGIESFFKIVKYRVKNQNWVEIKNPFLHQGLSNYTANFKLSFNHLGRTLYDKFVNQDNTLAYQDENNYNELLGFVELNLLPSESIDMSPEYIEWCRSRQRVPLGQHLNFGNIPDLDKHLTDYRVVIYRNVLKNNSFSIQLT
jgi:hypothetical protein